MPSAPRERKPALAALAVLLVALGAVAAGYLVINAGHRVNAIEVTQQVGQGQKIPASALREVQVAANSGVSYVAWQYAGRVTEVYASTEIPADTLLTQAMTSSTNSQAPGNLLIGDTVEAFPVGTGSGCATNGSTSSNGSASVAGVPITTGTIASVAGTVSGNGTTATVTLAVPDSDAGTLACYASAGDVAIALVPGTGSG
jgi:hypothetical protein